MKGWTIINGFYSTFSTKNPFLNIISGGKHKGIEKSVTDR
jgi:hypothetical protein